MRRTAAGGLSWDRRALLVVATFLSCPVGAQTTIARPDASIPLPQSVPAEQRIVRFAWRPPGAGAAEYEMSEREDQHQIVLTREVTSGGRYPVVIALHGQPRRGQSPRGYSFPKMAIDVAGDLVRRGQVEPLVLALPVFRYRGTNWPAFDLVEFQSRVEELLRAEGISTSAFYVVGHSGAAGCGGDGMNRAHRIHPAAVGFFDTCLGAGWRDEVLALRRARVPTLMIHSVETAGVVPRQAKEYSATFDFGREYAAVGLSAITCPEHVPAAPLRPQPFRCAADAQGTARAFVVDTGEGESAHEAVVPVALAYFLREYLAAPRRRE
jgi:hypothetical protein